MTSSKTNSPGQTRSQTLSEKEGGVPRKLAAESYPFNIRPRKGLLATLERHQIDGSLAIIASVLVSYLLFPGSIARKFLFFQEHDPVTNTVEKSWDDLYFMFFWITTFTFLRASVMQYVLQPLSRHWGATTDRAIQRFAEQGWIFIYYSCSWMLGMYCFQLTETWNNWLVWFRPNQFFANHPLTALPLVTKYYYWLQFSFWMQQMIVMFIEAPRKDFLALMTHHIVTVLLITCSLILNVTTFGTAVFVSMDLADIALSFGKCMKYIEVRDSICDPIFAVFVILWVYSRHFLYGIIIYAWMMYARSYYSLLTVTIVGGLLWALMALMFYWLSSIIRILMTMFKSSGGVVDDRSDEE
ncbi:sphingosine N-acyltransferase lag1 [Actinomortierella ambigua]|nr:sphingosine N-acyltransferase lag1 [Actinomortierella ambigua]